MSRAILELIYAKIASETVPNTKTESCQNEKHLGLAGAFEPIIGDISQSAGLSKRHIV